ncbi:MAG TPA: hypothetical protein DIU48_07910, partial [Acidobacteria bacterium]|nr:hypothetical protein [Acidobacteriota bacterium]
MTQTSTTLPLCMAAGLALGVGLASSTLAQPSDSPEVARHTEAARVAAGTDHPRFFEYLCRAPQRPRTRSPNAATRPVRREAPPRSDWYAAPAKVFDNLYFLGTQSLNAW